jgi:hypothetical protein
MALLPFSIFQEGPRMVLKNVLTAIVCTALFAWSGLSIADEYRPGEFLGLDLSQAVLSPKRLGPSSEFAPVPVEARADREEEGTTARAERITHPGTKLRICARKNRAARLKGNRRGDTAIRSMPRRWTRGFRSGRANRVASAIGNAGEIDRASIARPARIPAQHFLETGSARHDQIAAEDQQQG